MDIACVGGKLFFYSSNLTASRIVVLDAATLEEECEIDLASIRNADPEVQSTVKSFKITTTNPRIRLLHDNKHLVAICETSNPAEKGSTFYRYWADFFSVHSSGKATSLLFQRRLELRGCDIDYPKNSHDGITCKGCHRMNFTLKRYKCRGK